VAATEGARRPSWALPPHPPETWLGALWLMALALALALAVLVPLGPIWSDGSDHQVLLGGLRAAAGVGAVLAGFALLVQSTINGDRWVRWTSAGYALAFLLILARSSGGADRDLVEALSVLSVLAVPAGALTAPWSRRGLGLVTVPAVLLAAAAAAAVAARPDLLDGAALRPGTRVAWLLTAAVCAVGCVRWIRFPVPRRWVGAGLGLATLAAVLRASAGVQHDGRWWAGLAMEDLALLVPGVAVTTRTVLGYGLQSRRWRRLEEEVRALRRGSRLLEGRSITPEDDEGLPGQAEVRAILDAGAVRVALQPVIVLPTGAVLGHEALSRFGGRVPTDRWFKAANRYGLGDELERLCLGAALDLLPTLPQQEFLAVNVSPAALADPGVVGLLEGADLRRVVVEITEHEAVADYAFTRAVLGRLRSAGARIAVDDTGAGFASLRHVLMLQPDIIKLDIGLTRDVDVDRRQQALVRAVTAFAAQVGTTVLAEGVETAAQLDSLRDIGVHLGQGWHLGVPVLAGDRDRTN